MAAPAPQPAESNTDARLTNFEQIPTIAEYVALILASYPPLTPEQRARIVALLR